MGNITPPDIVRKSDNFGKVTSPFLANSIARFSADEPSISKQLSAFFSLRHEPDFRRSPKLARWLCRDAVSGRWRLANDEPLEAAKTLCEEASHVMGRAWFINSDAVARDVLRLAEFEPAMVKPVALKDCEAELERLLAARGRQ